MTQQAEAEIEVLVCTPAAGRASQGLAQEAASKRHDARCRRLARAYQSFAQQPVTRIDICRTPITLSTSVTSVATSEATTRSAISEAHRQPDTTAPPPGSALSAQFWSLSFESVCDNVQSPRVRHAVTDIEVEAADNAPGASAELLVSKIQPRIVSKRHSYVSPDDYIPDSQPDSSAEPTARKRQRRLTLDDDIETSDADFDETRILESQDLGVGHYAGEVVGSTDDIENVNDRPPQQWTGSPDLSAMPLDLDQIEDSLLEDSSQELPQRPPARRPLSQKLANSQSQQSQESQEYQKAARHDELQGHIPSSLPEEAGQIVASPSPKAPLRKPQKPLPVPVSIPVSITTINTSPKRRWVDKRPPRYQHHRVDEIEDADETGSASLTPIEIANISNITEISDTEMKSFGISETSEIPDTGISKIAEVSEIKTSAPVYSRHDSDLRILSPEPPVGCGHLDAASLITERLAELAQTLDLHNRFTKVAVRATGRGRGRDKDRDKDRDNERTRAFVRGYWVVDTAAWPAGQRQQSWEFLAKYVSSGTAGWSVWCSRRSREDRQLRLHCFEATAGHTYLLLYLASKRHILSTGAVWMDASGSPVITIPPRKRRDEGSSRPSSRQSSRVAEQQAGRPANAPTTA